VDRHAVHSLYAPADRRGACSIPRGQGQSAPAAGALPPDTDRRRIVSRSGLTSSGKTIQYDSLIRPPETDLSGESSMHDQTYPSTSEATWTAADDEAPLTLLDPTDESLGLNDPSHPGVASSPGMPVGGEEDDEDELLGFDEDEDEGADEVEDEEDGEDDEDDFDDEDYDEDDEDEEDYDDLDEDFYEDDEDDEGDEDDETYLDEDDEDDL
jgi:hypothetical protein